MNAMDMMSYAKITRKSAALMAIEVGDRFAVIYRGRQIAGGEARISGYFIDTGSIALIGSLMIKHKSLFLLMEAIEDLSNVRFCDWYNNFLTVEVYADHVGLPTEVARQRIEIDRDIREAMIDYREKRRIDRLGRSAA